MVVSLFLLSLSPSLPLSLSVTQTHTHIHTLFYTYTDTRRHTLTPTPAHAHAHAHAHLVQIVVFDLTRFDTETLFNCCSMNVGSWPTAIVSFLNTVSRLALFWWLPVLYHSAQKDHELYLELLIDYVNYCLNEM